MNKVIERVMRYSEQFLKYSVWLLSVCFMLFGLISPAWSTTSITGTIVSVELSGPVTSDVNAPPANAPSNLTAKITLGNNQSPGWLVIDSPYKQAMLMGVLANYATNQSITITGIETCGCWCTISTIQKIEFD